MNPRGSVFMAISVSVILLLSLTAGTVNANSLTTNNSTAIPWQEHIWGPTSGLYWLFYFDGTYYRYTTSACISPSCSWAPSTTIISAAKGINDLGFSISGTTLSYIGSKNSADSHFYFRNGTLTSSGTITWLSPEKTVSTAPYTLVTWGSLVTDSNGNLWAGMRVYDGARHHFEVYYHSNSVWTNSLDLVGPSCQFCWGGFLVPLTTGRIAAIYPDPITSSGTFISCSGIGCTWSTPAHSSMTFNLAQTSATAIGDTVEYCRATSTAVYYISYKYDNVTSVSTRIVATQSGVSGDCAITTDGASKLAIVYTGEGLSSVTSYVTSSDAGITWSAPTVIQSGIDCSQHQNIPPISSSTFPLFWDTHCGAPFVINTAIITY